MQTLSEVTDTAISRLFSVKNLSLKTVPFLKCDTYLFYDRSLEAEILYGVRLLLEVIKCLQRQPCLRICCFPDQSFDVFFSISAFIIIICQFQEYPQLSVLGTK